MTNEILSCGNPSVILSVLEAIASNEKFSLAVREEAEMLLRENAEFTLNPSFSSPLYKPISLELDLALNSYLYRLRESQEFEARKNSSGLFWFVIAVLVAVLSWAFF